MDWIGDVCGFVCVLDFCIKVGMDIVEVEVGFVCLFVCFFLFACEMRMEPS